MSNKNTGPSRGTLLGLLGGMPSMIEGIQQGKIGGKGIKQQKPLVPHNVCHVCGKAFNLMADSIPRPEEGEACPDCAATLRAGYTALRSDARYAFVKSAKLADLAGQVVLISPVVMVKLANFYNLEWKPLHDREKPKNPEGPAAPDAPVHSVLLQPGRQTRPSDDAAPRPEPPPDAGPDGGSGGPE